MTDPVDLEASAQLVELAAGRLSVEALMEATLARVAARNRIGRRVGCKTQHMITAV